MLLKDTAPAAVQPVPLDEFAAHLRLGHGFEDDGSENALLELYLRNATGVLETRLSQALIRRDYTLQTGTWDRHGHAVMPVGPVTEITRISLVTASGSADLAPTMHALAPGAFRQKVTGVAGGALPAIPPGGYAEITFTAGHGADWTAVPDDLRQAVLILAAHYYENRSGDPAFTTGLPMGVAALVEPHRPVRL